jgi:hypothetical protein
MSIITINTPPAPRTFTPKSNGVALQIRREKSKNTEILNLIKRGKTTAALKSIIGAT